MVSRSARENSTLDTVLADDIWHIYNLSSNRPERRTALMAQELAGYKVDITVLGETRFPQQGELEKVDAGCAFFWNAHPKAE
ncbi:hypothetical protein SprV_0301006600 [Sparganum proliferum]